MPRPGAAVAQFQDLNLVIHERTRLAIMTFLVSVKEVAFSDLKRELNLTDGNLNLHMKVLEKNGFVDVEKTFVQRRPRTIYRLTKEGNKAFKEYVGRLESILGLHKKQG